MTERTNGGAYWAVFWSISLEVWGAVSNAVRVTVRDTAYRNVSWSVEIAMYDTVNGVTNEVKQLDLVCYPALQEFLHSCGAVDGTQ